MTETPRPWTIYDDVDPLKIGIKGFDRRLGGLHVATVIMPENADLILRAVNNHDAMVAELQRLFHLYGHQATADVLDRVGTPAQPGGDK